MALACSPRGFTDIPVGGTLGSSWRLIREFFEKVASCVTPGNAFGNYWGLVMKISHTLSAVICRLGFILSLSVMAEDAGPSELVTLNNQYEAGLNRAKTPVLERYLVTLGGLLDTTTRAGNLEASLAVNKELESVKATGRTTSFGENLPELKAARDQYQKELMGATQPLHERYITALEALVTSYTKRGLLDEALVVNRQVEKAKAMAIRTAPPAAAQSSSRRPADAVFFQGKYYKTFDSVVSWTQAQEKCVEMGGQLATVSNAAENSQIIQMAMMGKRDAYWLGATDKVKEGQWVWVDGRPMTYTNWGRYQPNNKQLAEHYLVVIVRSKNASLNKTWSDQPKTADGHRPGFICEWR